MYIQPEAQDMYALITNQSPSLLGTSAAGVSSDSTFHIIKVGDTFTIQEKSECTIESPLGTLPADMETTYTLVREYEGWTVTKLERVIIARSVTLEPNDPTATSYLSKVNELTAKAAY